MITNTSVTVYNKYVDPSTRSEKFQRSTIAKALWESVSASVRAKMVNAPADTATIAIPFSECANYLQPKAWSQDKTGHWTLQDGDVIVRGTISDEITDLFTISDLYSKYDSILKISSVAQMDQGSPNTHHYLIGAK